jgi:hypothetical protein
MFMPVMAVAIAMTVFVGFARSYYLKAWSGAPALGTLVHLHGIVFSTWIALFGAQVALVGAGHTRAHRRLGAAGAVLALVVLVLGLQTTIEAARHGRTVGPFDVLGSVIVPFVDILVFAILFAAALALRRRREWHRRLMLLAQFSLLGAAIGRMPVIGENTLAGLGFYLTFVVAGPLYDWWSIRRVHAAYVWGGMLLVAAIPLKAVGLTEPWRAFAAWLVN